MMIREDLDSTTILFDRLTMKVIYAKYREYFNRRR